MPKIFHKRSLFLAYLSVADAKLYALDIPVSAQEVVSLQECKGNLSDSAKKKRRKKNKKYQKIMAAAGVLLVGWIHGA